MGKEETVSRTSGTLHFPIRDLSWLQSLGAEGPSGATSTVGSSQTALLLPWAWPQLWASVRAAQGLRAGLALWPVRLWASC